MSKEFKPVSKAEYKALNKRLRPGNVVIMLVALTVTILMFFGNFWSVTIRMNLSDFDLSEVVELSTPMSTLSSATGEDLSSLDNQGVLDKWETSDNWVLTFETTATAGFLVRMELNEDRARSYFNDGTSGGTSGGAEYFAFIDDIFRTYEDGVWTVGSAVTTLTEFHGFIWEIVDENIIAVNNPLEGNINGYEFTFDGEIEGTVGEFTLIFGTSGFAYMPAFDPGLGSGSGTDTVPVEGITISFANGYELTYVDETLEIGAVVNPINATMTNVEWISSDTAVATIAQGATPLEAVVTAVASGETEITLVIDSVTSNVLTVEVDIDTTSPILPDSITISFTNGGILEEVGKTLDIEAIVDPVDATLTEVIWTSSNPEVATVTQGATALEAVVTAVSPGFANIVLTINGVYSNALEVEVDIYGWVPPGSGSGSNGYDEPGFNLDDLFYFINPDMLDGQSFRFRVNLPTSLVLRAITTNGADAIITSVFNDFISQFDSILEVFVDLSVRTISIDAINEVVPATNVDTGILEHLNETALTDAISNFLLGNATADQTQEAFVGIVTQMLNASGQHSAYIDNIVLQASTMFYDYIDFMMEHFGEEVTNVISTDSAILGLLRMLGLEPDGTGPLAQRFIQMLGEDTMGIINWAFFGASLMLILTIFIWFLLFLFSFIRLFRRKKTVVLGYIQGVAWIPFTLLVLIPVIGFAIMRAIFPPLAMFSLSAMSMTLASFVGAFVISLVRWCGYGRRAKKVRRAQITE